MKKRVLAAFLLILALSAFLTSCKKEKSSFVSYQMFDYGVAALEIADDFLDDKITAYEAVLRLSNNIRFQEVHLSSEKEYLSDGPPIFDSNVIFETEFLMNAISDKAKGKCTIDKVKERYETLYETLYD